MKKTLLAVLALVGLIGAALLTGSGADAASNVLNYFQQNGAGGDNVFNLNGTWKVDSTSVTATGAQLNAAADRGAYATTIDAATDLSHAAILASKVFYVTPKGGTDVDISDDADFVADEIGLEIIFVITSAGDSAQGLTVTDGASGVVVKRVNSVGTSCEDVTDKIVCTVTAAERVDCVGHCAD